MGILADIDKHKGIFSAAVARLYQNDVVGAASVVVVGVATLPFRIVVFMAKKIAKAVTYISSKVKKYSANQLSNIQSTSNPDNTTMQTEANTQINQEDVHSSEKKNVVLSKEQQRLKDLSVVIGNRVHKSQKEESKVNTGQGGTSKVDYKKPSSKGRGPQ